MWAPLPRCRWERTNKKFVLGKASSLIDRDGLTSCAFVPGKWWTTDDDDALTRCSVMTGRPPVLKANAKGCRLYEVSVTTDDGIMYPTDAPADLVPVQVHGVGNCLFRSTSVLFFGKQTEHKDLRRRRAKENFWTTVASWTVLWQRPRGTRTFGTWPKKKSAGLSLSAKRGTSDFRDTYMIAEKSKPIYMYLSGCVPVDEKYGAQQAEKEEKRKRK